MTSSPDHQRLLRGSDRSLPPFGGVASADLRKLGRGAYVLGEAWDDMFAEARIRTLVEAAEVRQRDAVSIWSHTTAAALHGLPLYRVRSDRVEMITPNSRGRRNGPALIRHHARHLPADDITSLDGRRVTSLPRTVFDVIRTVPLEAAMACADAALHSIAWDPRRNTYDLVTAEAFRADLRRRIASEPGARGIRQARLVTDQVDGRAQSPGESVSRLWMWQVGAPQPELQLRVNLSRKEYALLDFAWPHLGRWGEFDGAVKYLSPEILEGRTAEDVLQRQNARQRSIEIAMGWRCTRWNFDRMASLGAFASFLRSQGIR